MSQRQQAAGPELLMQMFQGLQVSGMLAAAIQLGVFGALAPAAATAEDVAARLLCPQRSTRILLDVLATLGLLEKKDSTYALTPLAEAHLVPGKPMYLGDLTGLFASPAMWNGYQHFADAVKNDGTILTEHSDTPGYQFYEASARATGAMAIPAAAALDQLIADWIVTRPKVSVLDVAAGSGIYGFTLAKRPNVELTVLDWPNVLVEAKRWAVRLGVDPARVRYLEGSLFDVDFGGPHDLVLMSHIYHQFDRATCVQLTRKVVGALGSKGRVVINDFLFDETLANPAGALFSATSLVLSRKGEAFSEADYKTWVTDAGMRWVATFPGRGSSFLVAEKL